MPSRSNSAETGAPSKALCAVPPDGERGGNKAWLLETALRALENLDRPARKPDGNGPDPLLFMLLSRVEDWQELRKQPRSKRLKPIGTVTQMYGFTCVDALVWLRAGLPYAGEGDWETGEGFVLDTAWTFDWLVLVHGHAVLVGQEQAIHTLRLRP
jgi:hypothetical protein